MVVSCTRWLSIRLDLMSSLFVTIVAVAAILVTENPGKSVQATLIIVSSIREISTARNVNHLLCSTSDRYHRLK